MASELSDELDQISAALADLADSNKPFEADLIALESSAMAYSQAWGGSNLGFHSRVYHRTLKSPPPGDRFSIEWGFEGMFQGTTGDWQEFQRTELIDLIFEDAGEPDLAAAQEASDQCRAAVSSNAQEIASIVSTFLSGRQDDFLRAVLEEVQSLKMLSFDSAVKVQLPQGQIMSRDSVAIGQGLMAAPHQEILARVISIRSPSRASENLRLLAKRSAAHIKRLTLRPVAARNVQGSNVFIGHGQASAWREVKDFVQDRLLLPWDEFNRVPVAGITNIARLSEMLNDAGIAFLVLTAEDEQADGSMTARQNVVHEAGLFQGRLGFTRAIVLLEEGCAEFSNIQGLGQIRFPTGKVSAVFEDIRQVLEREGFVQE